MNICLLSDGIPGHVNQARGLVEWLRDSERLASSKIQVDEYDIKLRVKGLNRLIARLLLNFHVLNGVVIKLYISSISLDKKYDLIISMGGNTSFLNAALARYWGISNVFIGSLRHLKPSLFSAVCTLEPIGSANNVVMNISPTLVNPEKIKIAADNFLNTKKVAKPKKIYALIIGGDGAGFKYTDNDWQAIADWVNNLSDRDAVKWVITTSRRTGFRAEKFLRENIKSDNIFDAVWWGDKPVKNIQTYLGLADSIVVSPDSMSMIMESISSAKPVFCYSPKYAKPDSQYNEVLVRLYDSKKIHAIDSEMLNSAHITIDTKKEYDSIVNKAVNRIFDLIDGV